MAAVGPGLGRHPHPMLNLFIYLICLCAIPRTACPDPPPSPPFLPLPIPVEASPAQPRAVKGLTGGNEGVGLGEQHGSQVCPWPQMPSPALRPNVLLRAFCSLCPWDHDMSRRGKAGCTHVGCRHRNTPVGGEAEPGFRESSCFGPAGVGTAGV